LNAARRALLSLALGLAALVSVAHGETLRIVAAENFYADVARQIGGTAVSVTSILSNPAQDPHLFEVTPSAARAIAGAQIVIYNGIDYDPWMAKLLAAFQCTPPTADRRGRSDWEEGGRQSPHLGTTRRRCPRWRRCSPRV